jgi:hypothetical protein
MMNWTRLGLIYKGQGTNGWDLHSALTPTPFVFEDKIRIYAGFRAADGVSRIGYVDLDKNQPDKIIGVSSKPVLDIGRAGTFDDNGVILGDILRVGDEIYMYYVGFQLVEKVKFLAFTGLAISSDNGETFVRYSEAPVLDRKPNALFFDAVHTIMYKDGGFRCWLGAGSSWQDIKGKPYPSYNVKYIESADGINFSGTPQDCIHFSHKEEYRIGRPRVYFMQGKYKMIFTWGDIHGNYQMGYAESEDGIQWQRNDAYLNFKPATADAAGWDNQTVSYGALFEANQQIYMVYNGNEFGKDGFGLAKLDS